MQANSSHGSGLVPYDEYTFPNAQAYGTILHGLTLFLDNPPSQSELPEGTDPDRLTYIILQLCKQEHRRQEGEKIIITFPALVPMYNGPTHQTELFTVRRVFRSTWKTMERKSRKGGRNN